MFNLLSFNSFSTDNKDIDEEIENIDLSENNKLTTISNYYYYSSTLTVGTSIGAISYLKYDINEASEPDLKDMQFGIKPNILGLKASYNILFSNKFFAKGLGFFPRFGIDVDFRGYNILNRFWANVPKNLFVIFKDIFFCFINFTKVLNKLMCRRCCSFGDYIGFAKPSLKILNKPEFSLNTYFTFEPETSIYDKIRIVPQIGIGPSIINLYRRTSMKLLLKDTDVTNVENNLYPLLIDIGFSFKMILKVNTTSNFLNAFHLEVGYTYNPLILNLLFPNPDRITDGGIWNFFLSLNYARNFNIGLETVEFFNNTLETTLDKSYLKDSSPQKEINKKDTIFLDCGIGIGQWIDLETSDDFTRSICPMLQCSFMMPYFGIKIDEKHYLSFIGVDANEDLWTGKYHNKDHNIIVRLLNNLSVSYNFLTLLSDYKGVKFVHKLGVFVPLLTNMLGTFMDTGDSLSSYCFTREMIGVENLNMYKAENDRNSFLHFLVGRFTYKFRCYVDLFRLFNVHFKLKTYFYFGGNTILFNRRNDYSVANGSFNYEILKIESFNLGISFKFV